MPARRMRHRQIASDDFIRLDIDQDATTLFVLAPSAGGVRLAKSGDPLWPAVDNAEAIKVAAVVGRELGDELWSPDRGEAVIRVERRETGEASVNKHDRIADVRQLVNLNIARDVSGAGKIAR